MAVSDSGSGPRLPLFPDSLDGSRLPAGPGRHQAAVARGDGEPGRQHVALLAIRGRPDSLPGLPGRDASPVRERFLRVRHGERPDQPGRTGAGAADRRRPEQRGRRGGTRVRESDRGGDDRHRHPRHSPVLAPAAADRAMAVASVHRSRRLKLQAFRTVVFLLAAVFFLVPLIAMFEFSTRGTSGRTLIYWQSIFQYPDLINWNFGPAPDAAINASLELALITSLVMLVLLVPTMVW